MINTKLLSIQPQCHALKPLNPSFIMQSSSLSKPPPQHRCIPAATSQQEAAWSDLSSTLTLSSIRQQLILMEDTIIFSLIERAQYARNTPIYTPGGVAVPGYRPDGRQLTLLEWLLRETEQVHGRIRRYTSPDENAYFPEDLPPLVLPPMAFPDVLSAAASKVNINPKIMDMYLEHLLPEITTNGDDRNYGSAAMYDVMILQSLSRRIHYGKYVAEAKYRQYTAEYEKLIKDRDSDGIMELLTDRAVELKVIERVKLKAATFGRDLTDVDVAGSSSSDDGKKNDEGFRISPDAVAQLYDQWVMPLTKEVEVEYLLKRMD